MEKPAQCTREIFEIFVGSSSHNVSIKITQKDKEKKNHDKEHNSNKAAKNNESKNASGIDHLRLNFVLKQPGELIENSLKFKDHVT